MLTKIYTNATFPIKEAVIWIFPNIETIQMNQLPSFDYLEWARCSVPRMIDPNVTFLIKDSEMLNNFMKVFVLLQFYHLRFVGDANDGKNDADLDGATETTFKQ